jgi:hypothetical protein
MRPQSLLWEALSAWQTAFLFRHEKFRERHSETPGNSGCRPGRFRVKFERHPNNFRRPPGGHLYGVLRIWREPKETLRF